MRLSSAASSAVCSSSLLLLSIFFHTVLASDASDAFQPPFANLGDSATNGGNSLPYGAAGNFALSALVILVAALLFLWGAMIWFRDSLPPRYGSNLKFNVVTGQATMRDAPVRTLPTAEEAAAYRDSTGATLTFNENGQPASPSGAAASSTRFAAFWCPPCLLQCSCFSWLWCGPTCCCGQPTFSEWIFTMVHRNVAFRWMALITQIIIGGLNLLALGLDQWSAHTNVSLYGVSSSDTLYIGVIGLRINSGSGGMTHGFGCGNSSGTDLLQCNTFRAAAGFVLAFGIGSCLLVLINFFYSVFLIFPGRCYTPLSWCFSLANFATITAIVLLWPLSAQMVIKDTYDSSLALSNSWGIFLISWFLSWALTWYLKGVVTSTSLVESGDRTLIEAEANNERARQEKEREAFADAQRSAVLILNPSMLELEERRAEAAEWTKEGYGATDKQISPLEAYMQGDNSVLREYALRNPVVQRPYHANEPIPPLEALQPTWQELEVAAYEKLQRDRALWEEKERRRREREQINGPYTASPPKYIDAAEVDRRRAEAEREQQWRSDPLFYDLNDNGLTRRDALRSSMHFDAAHANPAMALSQTGYTYHANDEMGAVRVARDPNSLEATFERGEVNGLQQPAPWIREMSNGRGGDPAASGPLSPTSRSAAVAAANRAHFAEKAAHNKAAAGVGVASPIVTAPLENDDEDDDEPVPTGPNMNDFHVLSEKYIKDSLQLDEEELAMLSKKKAKQPQKPMVVHLSPQAQQEQDAAEAAAEQQAAASPSPLAHSTSSHDMAAETSQPLTPAAYRAKVAADRVHAPNLLTPPVREYMQQQQQQQQPIPSTLSAARSPNQARLPPIPFAQQSPFPMPIPNPSNFGYSRTYAPSQSQPHYVLPALSPLRSNGPHPFANNESMSPLNINADGRIYRYDPVSGRPSALNSTLTRVPLAATHTSSSSDLHFAGTWGSTQQQQALLARSGNFPQGLQHTTAITPRFALNSPGNAYYDLAGYPSSANSTGSLLPPPPMQRPPELLLATDQFNRTIPTPVPYPLPGSEDADVDEEETHAQPRRVPLTPVTPRIVVGPQESTVLRQTPITPSHLQRAPVGPYSQAFHAQPRSYY